jgi:signal transduction histidine kinase
MRFEKQTTILQDANQLISSASSPGKALRQLVTQLQRSLGYDAVMLWVLQPKEVGTPAFLSTALEVLESTENGNRRGFRLPLSKELIEANTPVVSNCLEKDERILGRDLFVDRGLVSSIGLPLVAQGQSQGALFFFTKRVQAFKPGTIRFLWTLADTVALHLHNARLQRKVAKLEQGLESATEDKVEFLGLLSRELRTPLTIVLGHAAMMHDGMMGTINPMQESGLEAIMRSSRDLLTMVKDALEQRVVERTAELSKTVAVLQEENVQRRRMERDLRRSREQLRELSRRILSVEEDERRRIAREVHDELGQALTALKIDLTWINQRKPEELAAIQTRTTTMINLVDRTIQEIRRISRELRPGLLDDLGLVAAIEWQTQEFQSRTGIKCQPTITPGIEMPDPDCSTAVFRIFQEALTNVARHAHATKVNIRLATLGGRLRLEVEDNGCGMKNRPRTAPKTFGLIGMRERVLPWGGKVEISSPKRGGTAVTVNMPMRRERSRSTRNKRMPERERLDDHETTRVSD